MKYKNIILINIISIVLILFSAKLFYLNASNNIKLAEQQERIQQFNALLPPDGTSVEAHMLMKNIANSSYESHLANVELFNVFAYLLLLFGILNIAITISVLRKC